MIKADIAQEIAGRAKVSRNKALQAVDVILEEMKRSLVRGRRIEIRGFGVFQKKLRKKSIGRDIARRTPVEIPPAYTVKFKPGVDLLSS